MTVERNHIYNADCMDGMAEMPDNFIDLAIVDPPYGIGDFTNKTISKKRNVTASKFAGTVSWNDSIPNEKYFKDLKRVSKHQIIWGANYFNCFDDTGGAIVWHKDTFHPNVSRCEIASCSIQKRVNYISMRWNSLSRLYDKNTNLIHPCQKPIDLYKWLLSNYAKEGDLILDTHMGSGSSYIACLDMGFDYIGFEIDADYFKGIEDRVYHFTRQRSLL